LNLAVDVSVFIDRLFIYNKERSSRTRELFRIIDDKSLNIFEPQVFGIELISQLVRRKPRAEAIELYNEIINRIIIID
jgi:predicted nucleic acid-binding protein